MQNDQGGSLRRNPGPSDEQKQEVQTIIENNEELKKLVEGGPELSASALSELQAPPWQNRRPQPGPTPPGQPQARPAPPPQAPGAPSGPFPWTVPQPSPPLQVSPQQEASQQARAPVFPDPVPLSHLSPSASQGPEPTSPAREPSPKDDEILDERVTEMLKPRGNKTLYELLSEYKCSFYWENDPRTFSAEAFLYGEVSDVAQVNQAMRVRLRSITSSEAASLDDFVPAPKLGVSWRPEILEHHRALARLALTVTHLNGSPLGSLPEERLALIHRLPEAMTKILTEVATEFYVRMNARLIGAQEQLKN